MNGHRPTCSRDDALERWARSGAMSLTGRRDGAPLGPPAQLLPALDHVVARITSLTRDAGRAIELDPLAILVERAALAGLRRGGDESCGGGTRLLPTADGWIAVTLSRADDLELLPAWLGLPVPPTDARTAFARIAPILRSRSAQTPVAEGIELGLAVSQLDELRPRRPAVREHRLGDAPPRPLAGLRVVDLSALWAGPLAGRLLADSGADVIKVESTLRPDGARLGDPRFFDLMNASKRSVALDWGSSEGVTALRRLIASADVVIDASRPRALETLGVDARTAAASGPQVWLSITGHGREQPMRVAFGDDAAVAGGAVARDEHGPCFCSDALADPITGLVAALAVLDRLRTGGRWLLDVSLAACAATVAGPTLPTAGLRAGVEARPPTDPIDRGRARPLGADTDAVLADCGP